MTIGFYLQQGVEILDFAGPMEVFSKAGYNIFTISKSKGPVISQGIMKIIPDYDLSDAPACDVLAFFGGDGVKTSQDKELTSWIRSRKENTTYFFSVCSGSFILGEAGLLEGLTATTYYGLMDEFRASFVDTNVVSNSRFVDNGKIITTAGVSAGIDGALYFVSKISGEPAARKAAEKMEYDKWVPGEGLIIYD